MIDAARIFATGAVLGLAGFGIAAHAALLLHRPFAAAALPACLVLGFAWALRRARTAPSRPPPPRWLTAASALAIGAAALAIAYGALATPARHWDGTVAWELRATFLTAAPTLEQAFFLRPEVFSHSRDYPLLQPLCVAAGNLLLGDGAGRVLFPFLYLVLVAAIATAVRQVTARPWLTPVATTAAALTPLLVNSTMGSADSGFAELFLATSVAALAAGVVHRDRTLIGAAVLVAVLVKPEGIAYGVLPLALGWWFDARWLARPAAAGLALGALLWLPLHDYLLRYGAPPRYGTIGAGVLGLIVLVWAAERTRARLGASRGRRLALLAAAAALVVLAFPLIADSGAGGHGTFALYLGDATRPLRRLARLPEILYWFGDHALRRMQFAATFALFFTALAGYAWHRRRPAQPLLTALAIAGVGLTFAPLLLSPEDNIYHHARSSLSRYMVHWLAPLWLCNAIWTEDHLDAAAIASAPAGPTGYAPAAPTPQNPATCAQILPADRPSP